MVGNSQTTNYTFNQLDTDLIYLDSIFSKIHPHNFPSYNQRRLTEHRNALKNKYKDIEISPFNYNLAIRAAIDSFACIHTYIDKNPIRPKEEFNYFSGKVFAHSKKLYYIQKAIDTTIIGDSIAEIISINGTLSHIFLDNMLVHHCPDGHSEAFGYKLANLLCTHYIADELVHPEKYILNLLQTNGSMLQVTLRGIAQPTTFAFENPKLPVYIINEEKYKFAFMNDTIAYLNVKSFAGNYKTIYRKAFAYSERNNCNNMIIDLRGNLGGTRKNGMELLSYLVSQKVRYEIIRPSIKYSPYLTTKGKQRFFFSKIYYNIGHLFHRKKLKNASSFVFTNTPKKNQFKGNVYVLIDGFTSSTSALAASFLKENDATIIGQQSGGGQAGNYGGTFQNLILPISKIEVHFPLMLVRYDVKSTNYSGIMPDYTIDPKPEFAGIIDQELKKALELIQKK
jgi:hypothetical protein